MRKRFGFPYVRPPRRLESAHRPGPTAAAGFQRADRFRLPTLAGEKIEHDRDPTRVRDAHQRTDAPPNIPGYAVIDYIRRGRNFSFPIGPRASRER